MTKKTNEVIDIPSEIVDEKATILGATITNTETYSDRDFVVFINQLLQSRGLSIQPQIVNSVIDKDGKAI